MSDTTHPPTTPRPTSRRKPRPPVPDAWKSDPKLAPANLTPDQAAELVQVSRRTIERKIASGAIRARKAGHRLVRVNRDSLIAYFAGEAR